MEPELKSAWIVDEHGDLVWVLDPDVDGDSDLTLTWCSDGVIRFEEAIGEILKETYTPAVVQHLNVPPLPLWLREDGWPRRWVFFPRLWRAEVAVKGARWDLSEWWGYRPAFLGGSGVPE